MKRLAQGFFASRLFSAVAAVFALAFVTPVEARWLKATTENFVVYSAGSESDLRASALKLEKFDALLRWLNRHLEIPPSEAKLPVYWIRGINDLRLVWPNAPEEIGGFYSATAGATAAIVTRRGIRAEEQDDVLFHEYTHHFMLQNSRVAYPSWYIEGFAEYVSTVRLEERIELGRYAKGRAQGLTYLKWLPYDLVIAKSPFDFESDVEQAQYYGQAWLLAHYLLRDPERLAQLEKYLQAVANGEKSWPAFQRVFGMSASALEKRLIAYAESEMTYTTLNNLNLASASDVQIAALPAAADNLLLPELGAALDAPGAATTLARIRKEAAAYPGDRYAQRVLALGEIVHGDPHVALHSLGNVSGLDGDAEGLYLYGFAKLQLALRDASRREELLKDARIAFVSAYGLRPNHYQTLYRYVQANYADNSRPVPESVLDVLIKAYLLAPQVNEIGLAAATALMRVSRFEEAILILEPMANDPHDPRLARTARRLLDLARQRKPPNDGKWEFKPLTSYH